MVVWGGGMLTLSGPSHLDCGALPPPSAPPPPGPPARGDFELLRVIGQGAFGKAWKVLHRSTGLPYAMKVRPPTAGPSVTRRGGGIRTRVCAGVPCGARGRLAYRRDSSPIVVLFLYRFPATDRIEWR